MKKKSIFILLFLLSATSIAGIDSTLEKINQDRAIAFNESDFFEAFDTLLISSTLLDPQKDLFTPSFFSVNSGLYKFPILFNLEDYGWMSECVMLSYDQIVFKTDTIPLITAKYDYSNTNAHWFNSRLDRKIGKSKLSAQLNRNFQNSIYNNSMGKRFNFSIGADLPFQKNYKVTLSYHRNSASIQENGGFINANSIFAENNFNVLNFKPHLTSASNTIFLQKASVLQEIKINSKINFDVYSNYEENQFSFNMFEEDIDVDFFSQTYLDSTETSDSVGFKKFVIEPIINLGKLKKIKGKSLISAGIHKEFNDKLILNNSYALTRLNFVLKKTLISLSGKYHFENIWKGNFNFNGKSNIVFNQQTQDTTQQFSNLSIQCGYVNELPSYLFINYHGNHFQWENNFSPMKKIKINAKLNLKVIKSSLALKIQNISNYIYLDENSFPQQTSENITVGRLSIKKSLGNKFIKFHSGLGFQYTTSNLIRIPSFYTRSSLVYEFKLRKVPFNLGSTVNFFSKYNGLNYNPAIRHYHLGNQMVGGIPVVDFFLASRLGPADLYIKYVNAMYSLNNELFIGENYPITNSFFRLGLKWNLTN